MKKENKYITENILPDKIISAGLIFIYLSLTVFGIISLSNPKWLVGLSYSNKKMEVGLKIIEGIKLSHENKEREAIEKYNEALALMPDFVEAVINKGVSYKRLMMYERALFEFKKALNMSPKDSSNIYSNIKDIYLDKKDSMKADFFFQKSIHTNHSTIDKFMKKGIHYYNLKNLDSSLSAYFQALNQREMFTFYKDVIDKELLTTVTKINSKSKGISYFSGEKEIYRIYDSVCFQLNLSFDRGLAENYNKIGFIIALQGDYETALGYFLKAVNIWNDYPDAKANIMFINEKLNKKY